MRLFHTTDAADAILSGGFRDHTPYARVNADRRGVFLANTPVQIWTRYFTMCRHLLEVVLPDDVDLAEFELADPPNPLLDCRWSFSDQYDFYREWCVPAALLNEHATVTLLDLDEEEDR